MKQTYESIADGVSTLTVSRWDRSARIEINLCGVGSSEIFLNRKDILLLEKQLKLMLKQTK